MVISTEDKERYVKFDGEHLYLKVNNEIRKLGTILTRKGGLTREQKLKAVANTGEWIKL